MFVSIILLHEYLYNANYMTEEEEYNNQKSRCDIEIVFVE